jgi:Vault protein inter-alpha-trypsin domain
LPKILLPNLAKSQNWDYLPNLVMKYRLRQLMLRPRFWIWLLKSLFSSNLGMIRVHAQQENESENTTENESDSENKSYSDSDSENENEKRTTNNEEKQKTKTNGEKLTIYFFAESPIECKYVFELAAGSAVCGFEAFIQNKHIIGKVEEKKQAHEKYKKAVETGKRAYLFLYFCFAFSFCGFCFV